MVWFEPNIPRKRLGGQLTWFLSWLVITMLGVFILRPNPAGHGTHQQLGLPPCPAVMVFGRPCPGCGLTTSWTNVMHGNWLASWEAHPLGGFLYALFTVSAGACLYGWVKEKRFVSDSRPANMFLFGVAIAVVGFGVWRFATLEYNTHASALEQLAKVNRQSVK